QVQHHVAQPLAVDHHCLVVVLVRGVTERAAGAGGPVRGLVLTVDVGHPVRGRQPVVPVPDPGVLLGGILGHTCTFVAIASVISATASATGTPLRWLPSRNRKETAPASASSPPAISTNGTFCLVALRIFLLNRSSEESSSARTPAARSCGASSPRYSEHTSAAGMACTCTGASHGGKAPA